MNVAATTALALAAAPATTGASVVAAAQAAQVVVNGAFFDKCATDHEKQQVREAVNSAAAKECEAKGGTALLSYNGSVVCAVSQ